MGGSAIGADLVLACLPELPVPAVVVRGYELPAWAGRDTLVVAVSYSGDTEETLACAADAMARGCTPVCVASGGASPRSPASAACRCSWCPAAGSRAPRWATSAMPLLAALEAAGLCADSSADVDETVALLRDGNEALGPQAAAATNAAKQLAGRLLDKQAVVYGAGLTVPAARRWKGQVNENAKAPAFWNELPELDHNELMGWTSLPHVAAATRRGLPRRRARRPAAPAPRRAHRRRAAGARRRRGARRGARGVAPRAPVLACPARRLRRPSIWRSCTASTRRRWRRSRSSRPSSPAAPAPERMPGAAVSLVLTADEPAARGAAGELFPDAEHVLLTRPELRPAAPFAGRLFAILGAQPAGSCVGLVVPVVWRADAAP